MPELQAVIEDKAQIPPGLENFYTEKDGKFTLQVEGMKTQADFDAYADALKKRFTDAGADFAKHKGANLTRDDVLEVVNTALDKFAGSQGGGKGGDDKGAGPDSNTAQRLHDLERNVASLTEQNEKLVSERDSAIEKSKTTTIRNALSDAAQKAGAIPEGISNLVTLAEGHFEMTQDGSVVTRLDNGQTPNQSPSDFFAAASRKDEFRMFWPASKGAGAGGGDGAGAGAGDLGGGNPWTKAGWNLTKQGQLYKADPQEAQRLMDAAGVKLGATEPVR